MDSEPEQSDRAENKRGRAAEPRNASRLARAILGLKAAALGRSGRELWELETMLSADYRANAAVPSRTAARRLATMVERELPALNQFRTTRRGARWQVSEPAACCSEIALRAAPYTEGVGLGLWGFSCAMRKAGRGTFVIYLNTAHLAGAVAVTAAHEMGHYFHHSMFPASEHVAFAPMAADFTSHLRDHGELFSDSAAALAAFSPQAADEIVRHRREPMAQRIRLAQEIARPGYRMEFGSAAMSPRWRLRYLTATVHLANLRLALRQSAGV